MGVLRAIVAAVVLLPLFLASRAVAAPIAHVDPSTTYLTLAPHLDVFEDTSARLGIDDVTRPEIAARFAPFHGAVGPNYAYTTSALWARVSIENTSDSPLERWVVVDAPWVENVAVFRDGERPAVQGLLHPRDGRELPRRGYSFRLVLAPHETRVVHVRAWSHAEVMLPLELWGVGALGQLDRRSATISSVSLGVMLAMALYNAFLFLFIKDRARLYYAGYVVLVGVWCMCLDGSLLDALPARVQVIPEWVNVVTVYGATGLAGLFVRAVLRLRAARPRLDRWLLAILVAALTVGAAYLCGVIDYRTQNLLARPAVLVVTSAWITAAVLRWRDGLTTAAYVSLAWVAMLALWAISNMGLYGIIPLDFRYGPPSNAYAIEAILLSLALAEDTRQRGREVVRLNEELRHQVAERSRELTEALAQSEGSVAPVSLDTGDVFDGRYRVLRLLGRGGMGAVYEVARALDGRHLALKVVTVSLSAKHAARFAREAEIGARLHHENLVSIVDVGIAARATPFLVMELVEGGSMEDRRDRFGEVSWALPVLRQIASGLAALHANHVVHRDLKPGNVLLADGSGGRGSVAKISDFGISRFGAPDDSADVDPRSATMDVSPKDASPRNLTEPGGLMGTPVYMPPEAWSGAAREPSADVFSFGVVAYEALTGRSPFPVPPVLLARAGQPLPEPVRIDGVPPDVATLVLACLRAQPSQRPSAAHVAEGL
jgi:hypothetical protein